MPFRRRLDRAVIFLRRRGVVATLREVASRAQQRLLSKGRPTAVHIEISGCCNLHCEYCALDQATTGAKVMSMSTFDAVLPALSEVRRIDLSGLAEPLMNKHLVEMLIKARAASPHAHIALSTNATILTPEISEQLIREGLDELVFSLDGVDPGQVDAIRTGGSLNDVTTNIRELRDLKQRMGSTKPAVSAAVVLQHSNLAQLPDIVRLASELGCEGVSVNGLEPYSAELVESAIWIDPSASPGLEETLRDAQAVARSLGVDLRLPAMSVQAALCPQAARPIILADGSVVPCSVLAYSRPSFVQVDEAGGLIHSQRDVQPLAFGNISAGGVEAIWNSDAYRAFRHRVASGNVAPECETCLMTRGVICSVPPLTADQSIASISQR